MAAETCAERKVILQQAMELLSDMDMINTQAAIQEEAMLDADIADASVSTSVQLLLNAAGTATTGLQAQLITLLGTETWTYKKRLG